MLVEGGAAVAHAFHAAGLVDRYVLYLAPALFGGDDARPLFAGPGAATMADLWRGQVRSVTSLGGDLRVELAPPSADAVRRDRLTRGRTAADRRQRDARRTRDRQHGHEGDTGSMPFSAVEDAIEAVGRGEIVVVVDDEDRENEGDLIMAADAVTPEKIAFFLAHTSGLICVPLTPERVEQLDLPLMVTANTEVQRTAFTVSVDYRHGTTTGISAADRVGHHQGAGRPPHPSDRPQPARATSSPSATDRAAC